MIQGIIQGASSVIHSKNVKTWASWLSEPIILVDPSRSRTEGQKVSAAYKHVFTCINIHGLRWWANCIRPQQGHDHLRKGSFLPFGPSSSYFQFLDNKVQALIPKWRAWGKEGARTKPNCHFIYWKLQNITSSVWNASATVHFFLFIKTHLDCGEWQHKS